MNCHACDSQTFSLLGYIGDNTYLRCRCCGMDYITSTALLDNSEDDDA